MLLHYIRSHFVSSVIGVLGFMSAIIIIYKYKWTNIC